MWAGDYYVISDSDGNYHGEFLSSNQANEYVYQLIDNNQIADRTFTIHHSRNSYKEQFRGRLSVCEEVGNLSLVEQYEENNNLTINHTFFYWLRSFARRKKKVP